MVPVANCISVCHSMHYNFFYAMCKTFRAWKVTSRAAHQKFYQGPLVAYLHSRQSSERTSCPQRSCARGTVLSISSPLRQVSKRQKAVARRAGASCCTRAEIAVFPEACPN